MKSHTIAAAFAALLALAVAPAPSAAQGDASIYSEQNKLVRASGNVSDYGTDLFGDSVGLSSGRLEFVQTEFALPGNDRLPVAVSRRLTTGSRDRHLRQALFGDWDIELPRIHGMFATGANNYGWSIEAAGADKYKRCSLFGPPPPGRAFTGGTIWEPEEYWFGVSLYAPGQGDQPVLIRSSANTNKPTDGAAYPLVTKAGWQIGCLPTLRNGAGFGNAQGEGFFAVSPDGTRYEFDQFVERSTTSITKPSGAGALAKAPEQALLEGSVAGPGAPTAVAVATTARLYRGTFWILPSRATDRFGNTVTYAYDSIDPWKLLSIRSSDGRNVDLTYVPNTHRAQTVSDGTRTWLYSYDAYGVLSRVTQPDGSAWQYSNTMYLSEHAVAYSTSPTCTTSGTLAVNPQTATMVHPGGATAAFTVNSILHGRSDVPQRCSFSGGVSYASIPLYYGDRSITSKTISGPGLQALTWSYAYSPPTPSWSPCNGCVDTKTVNVTDPRGYVTRHTFGTRYANNEAQLLRVEEAWNGSSGLRTTTLRYRSPTAGPYPALIGASPDARRDHYADTRHIPQDQRVITQQGVSFTWQAIGFDSMARPTTVTRSSSLGPSRTETTAYYDHTAKWVLGQTKKVTESGGKVMLENVYDEAVTGNLLSTLKFGLLDQRFTYYPDGTLWTRADGLNQTTTFSNYWRGLARNAQYADGRTESATIDNRGLITSVTDANNFTTNYGYDLIGRLNLITRPAGDTVAWNFTSLAFELVAADEYGLGTGHWRQTVTTGNAKTITYFDALWRPRVTRTFDAANDAGTAKTVLRNFDSDNRKVFESYPARNVASITATPPGTSTAYDGLGRPFKVFADSELGLLTTSIDYLASFQKRVTNPRGYATTTGYQVFDEPSEAAIATIAAPETLSVNISRDLFGKPTSITRSGTAGGTVSATRSYVYDSYERLCKTVEPETGATVQQLDAANNTTWRATARELSTSLVCDPSSVSPYYKVSYGYDTRNRLTRTSFADGYPSITRTYTPDGLPATVVTAAAGVPGFSTWTYGYNKRRLLEQETLTYAGQSYPIAWRFNPNGHTSQLTYPDGAVIAYTPNALGEATQVGSYATSVNYWPNGEVSGYTLGSGITNLLYQNTRGLPNWSRDSGVTQDLYSYDAGGNLTSITNQWESINRTMSYDGLDRLTSTNAPLIWGNATYGYDALDNIRTSVVGSRNSTHIYDAINRLSYITTNGAYSFYLYDSRGNVTARGGKGFYFDLGNRMQNSNDAYYTYDGLGRRTSISAADGTTKIQVYSQTGKLLYGTQQQGMVVRNTRYVYLGNKLIAEVGTSTGTEYVHTDTLGSPVARTNSSGVLLTRTRYEPYGKTAAGTEPNGIGFTGHVNDPDTGLVYMQQRYYDPIAGRFLSVDPVTTDAAMGDSFNRYVYGNNNPYKFKDPDGRHPVLWGVAVVVARVVGTVAGRIAGAARAAARNERQQDPKQRGRESEDRVLKDMGKEKNTTAVEADGKKSIPDFQDSKQIGEIKDTKRVTDTEQIRTQRDAAKAEGKEHVVVTGTKTDVSAPVQENSTVIRRPDLGPK